MKIAFAVFEDISGGGPVAHRVQMLATGLASLGHEVHIFSPVKYQPGPLREEMGGVALYWGAHAQKESANHFLAKVQKRYLIFKLARRVLHQGLDWLILYDMGLDALPLVFLARRTGCRVASENCDINFVHYKGALREYLLNFSQHLGHLTISPHLDINFVISRSIERRLKSFAPKVPRVIVPAPVDLDKFYAKEDRREEFRHHFRLHDTMVIGYFGSPHKVKGLEVLLEAAKLLINRGIKFKLLISGRTDHNLPLLRVIDELELNENLVLTGFIPDEDLITAMSAADILVEPKIEHGANWAAFPQKLAEYLAMGKPIVASAIGDITQYLQDQENALLCRAGDPHSMADALELLMADPVLREKLALNARRTAEKYFDCNIIARKIVSALST